MQRYKIRCNDCDPKITPHENGKWVRWGDVERLRAELAEYKRDAERYRAVRYANVHNIDPDYQGVMNDEMPVFEQMEDLDKVVDGLKVKVDAALAAKEE